jgi:uncharacterized protein YyaL (SSP411 family)
MGGSGSQFDIGFSLGWSGQAVVPLLEYSKEYGVEEAKDIAVRIANWIVRNAQTDYGAYHEVYDVVLKEGADFIGEDLVYTHTTARNAAELLKAYLMTGKEDYLRSGLKACDWLRRHQTQEGSIPWMFTNSTGEPWEGTFGAASAQAIVAWCRAYEITHKPEYLQSAQRMADFVVSECVYKRRYGSFITDDLPVNGFNRWEVPSPTAICWVIDGLVELFKRVHDEKYLRAAKEAGYLLLLHQWPWEFPEGSLRRRVKGTTQASSGMPYTVDQVLGSELPLIVEALLTLCEATGEAIWWRALHLAMARLVEFQFSDPKDEKYGAILEGWSLNKDRPLPRWQGNVLFANRIPSIAVRYSHLTSNRA